MNNIVIKVQVSAGDKWIEIPFRTARWQKGKAVIVHPCIPSLPACFVAKDFSLLTILAEEIMPWLGSMTVGKPLRVIMECASVAEKENV